MLIVTIAKRFTFDAAHYLGNLPEGHKCRGMHGHTYAVELEFTGPVKRIGPEVGFLIDYQVIADAWQPLHQQLDHRVLNEVSSHLAVPSTEHLAMWIVRRLADLECFSVPGEDLECFSVPGEETILSQVTVYESTTTWCRARVEDMWWAGVCKHRPWRTPRRS